LEAKRERRRKKGMIERGVAMDDVARAREHDLQRRREARAALGLPVDGRVASIVEQLLSPGHAADRSPPSVLAR
jgi:hypothetical protein